MALIQRHNAAGESTCAQFLTSHDPTQPGRRSIRRTGAASGQLRQRRAARRRARQTIATTGAQTLTGVAHAHHRLAQDGNTRRGCCEKQRAGAQRRRPQKGSNGARTCGGKNEVRGHNQATELRATSQGSRTGRTSSHSAKAWFRRPPSTRREADSCWFQCSRGQIVNRIIEQGQPNGHSTKFLLPFAQSNVAAQHNELCDARARRMSRLGGGGAGAGPLRERGTALGGALPVAAAACVARVLAAYCGDVDVEGEVAVRGLHVCGSCDGAEGDGEGHITDLVVGCVALAEHHGGRVCIGKGSTAAPAARACAWIIAVGGTSDRAREAGEGPDGCAVHADVDRRLAPVFEAAAAGPTLVLVVDCSSCAAVDGAARQRGGAAVASLLRSRGASQLVVSGVGEGPAAVGAWSAGSLRRECLRCTRAALRVEAGALGDRGTRHAVATALNDSMGGVLPLQFYLVMLRLLEWHPLAVGDRLLHGFLRRLERVGPWWGDDSTAAALVTELAGMLRWPSHSRQFVAWAARVLCCDESEVLSAPLPRCRSVELTATASTESVRLFGLPAALRRRLWPHSSPSAGCVLASSAKRGRELEGAASRSRRRVDGLRRRRHRASRRLPPVPLSQCALWADQSGFYERSGMEAWSTGAVPFQITSSVRFAWAHAEVVLALAEAEDEVAVEDWLTATADAPRASSVEPWPARADGLPAPSALVIELGSGSCKFGYHLAARLRAQAGDARGSHPCVVLTDVSAAVLHSVARRPEVAELVEGGWLDFAVLDCSTEEEAEPVLQLLCARCTLRSGTLPVPVVVVASYVFDSLPADIVRTPRCDESSRELELGFVELVEARTPSGKMRPLIEGMAVSFKRQPPAWQRTQGCSSGPTQAVLQWLSDEAPPGSHALLSRATLAVLHRLRCLQGDGPPMLAFVSDKTVCVGDEAPYSGAGASCRVPHLAQHGGADGCVSLAVDIGLLDVAVRRHWKGRCLHAAPRTGALQTSLLVIPGSERHGNRALRAAEAAFHSSLGTVGADDYELISGHLERDADARRGFTDDPQRALALLRFSCFDLDVFRTIAWDVARVLASDATDAGVRQRLVEAAMECFAQRFELPGCAATSAVLFLARWLYRVGEPARAGDVLLSALAGMGRDASEERSRMAVLLAACGRRLGEAGLKDEALVQLRRLGPAASRLVSRIDAW